MMRYFLNAIKSWKKAIPVWLLASIILIAAPNAWGKNPNPPTVIPVYQTTMANGEILYFIYATIGNAANLPVMLDTGSTGLRVASQVIDPSSYTTANISTEYTYGQDRTMNGIFANTQVTISGMTAEVPIQVIQSSTCTSGHKCQLAQEFNNGLGFGTEVNEQGFYAIMGIGLRGSLVPNPLTLLGNGTWVVDLPVPGQTHPGRLVLNPRAIRVANYPVSFQLSQCIIENIAGWADNQLPVYIQAVGDADGSASFQGNALMDSGGSNVGSTGGNRTALTWPTGTLVDIVLGNNLQFDAVEYFNVGALPNANVYVDASSSKINLGPLFFYSFSVYYDNNNGIIALNPREDFLNMPPGYVFINAYDIGALLVAR